MKKWEIVGKLKDKPSLPLRGKSEKLKVADIINVLLSNRGIKNKREREEFFDPTMPEKVSLSRLGIKITEVNKAIKRIKKAKKKKEKVIVFGDYDADGVCATAILWECLYGLGLDVLPYIPERFSEGYGLKEESVISLREKFEDLRLIITVDNGIVANEAVNVANKLGIDVIISDHHLPRINAPREREAGRLRREVSSVRGQKDYPKAQAIIHTDKIGGAGIAWIVSREISRELKNLRTKKLKDSLELAAIGTIADQLPLVGPNRSFAKYGLEALNKTERIGLLALFEEAAIKPGTIATYEVNFIIAPRLNAMGRMLHAIDSLRLLCTQNKNKARQLASLLGKTNFERQKIVEEVVAHAKVEAEKRKWEGIMILHHESYHEGVIGLAASRLVEEFWRPAIVFSKGENYSKASARSIPGFNIIAAIRELDDMLLDGGGHPMAAGFTIATSKLERFTRELDKVSSSLLTEDLLTKKLKVDLELNFNQLNWELVDSIKKFEPTGVGNPTPTFVSRDVSPLDARVVGRDRKHLKLKLGQEDQVFDAIAFGFGELSSKLYPGTKIDIAYNLEENVWNGDVKLQLKVKDIDINDIKRRQL